MIRSLILWMGSIVKQLHPVKLKHLSRDRVGRSGDIDINTDAPLSLFCRALDSTTLYVYTRLAPVLRNPQTSSRPQGVNIISKVVNLRTDVTRSIYAVQYSPSSSLHVYTLDSMYSYVMVIVQYDRRKFDI